jgi:hypothetical protein
MIIEVGTDREENLALHRRVAAEVAAGIADENRPAGGST